MYNIGKCKENLKSLPKVGDISQSKRQQTAAQRPDTLVLWCVPPQTTPARNACINGLFLFYHKYEVTNSDILVGNEPPR